MHIVKRKGHKQEYDEKKVYASVYAAFLAAHGTEEEAEMVADKVTEEINKWVKEKDEVSSREVFEKTGRELERLNKEAALMYNTHRDLS